MRLFLIRLLMRFLGGYAPKNHEGINEDARDEWLLSLIFSEGFKSYFKYRDYQLMKTMANGLEQKDYWRLIGQRTELLYLAGESERLRKKVEEASKKQRKQEQ